MDTENAERGPLILTCALNLATLMDPAIAHAQLLDVDTSHQFEWDTSVFDPVVPNGPVGKELSARTGKPGDGKAWRAQLNVHSTKEPKPKGSKRGRRGKGSRTTFFEKVKTNAQPSRKEDKDALRTRRLQKSWLSKATVQQTTGYSILRDGSRSSTGWTGLAPPKQLRSDLTTRFLNGELNESLRTFYQVPYSGSPTMLVDNSQRVFFYRTTPAQWVDAESLWGAMYRLTSPSLGDSQLRAQCSSSERGPHFPCILGHHRQSCKVPILTQWHRQNQVEVDIFLSTETFRRLVGWVTTAVNMVYPGVAARFRESAEWHQKKYQIQPLFGLFWNFCINMPFPDQKRIQCLPHSDSKNVIGVCVVFVYLKPGGYFDHKSKTWLVLWEAGVIIELPPWVTAIYPSSLLYHFNIDISDLHVVVTADGQRPTPTNSHPASLEENGRGSVVFFNQATMYQSSETGFNTLDDAKKAGHSGVTDFGKDAQSAFHIYGTLVPGK